MTTTATDLALCLEPGCEVIAKTAGRCNAHYMAWYREQRVGLENEVRKAFAKFGPAADYLCEGSERCKEIPVRWWVKDGDGNEPLALCHTHTEAVLSDLRENVRRLELKV